MKLNNKLLFIFILLFLFFYILFNASKNYNLNNINLKDYYIFENKENQYQKNFRDLNNQNLNCQNIPELEDNSKKLVTKIIDGDTFIIEGGYLVRILGIDADEKGYDCYDEAKTELEELILNKEVRLERDAFDLDQYCRYLRYVFIDNKNISLEMIKNGLAVARFNSENEKYKTEIINAEKLAIKNQIGCKWNKNNQIISKDYLHFNLNWSKLTTEITGLKIIPVCSASKYYNQEIIVEGKIVSVYRSKTNTIFLNFGKNYPNNCFTAVIFNSDQKNFMDNLENYYENKIVRIRGIIKEYKGKPEIILKNQSQIEVGN
ncbi:MAG: thermonuclease family protein [Patescibacteria group bacterium]|nr:thermonuclease family protein [Patescibacteria group bacterium]